LIKCVLRRFIRAVITRYTADGDIYPKAAINVRVVFRLTANTTPLAQHWVFAAAKCQSLSEYIGAIAAIRTLSCDTTRDMRGDRRLYVEYIHRRVTVAYRIDPSAPDVDFTPRPE
jgi:hypothetical protein